MQLTSSQRAAVEARGNVLVSAAAGTGKTGTLVARCLRCLSEESPRASLDELLVVTFTEAAAAEMRERLRAGIEERRRAAPDPHWEEQLALFDAAHIGTLHSFCFQLVRRHFYELQLDPQLSVLDEGEARLLAGDSLEAVLQRHYTASDERAEAVRRLVESQGGGRGDRAIRAAIQRLHDYIQTRPDPVAWLEAQLNLFAAPDPVRWREWLEEALAGWREESTRRLEILASENEKAAECLALLRSLPAEGAGPHWGRCLAALQQAGATWPARKKTLLQKPLEEFLEDVEFLSSLIPAAPGGADPLAEDWNWTRGHLAALLQLAGEFEEHFQRAKREAGVADFHDLEQFALQLLWDFKTNRPTPIAEQWRRQIRFVFVDEYQDINAAQDKIIEALSRGGFVVPPSGGQGAEPPEGGTTNPGNRFLVGDVKQSIYRFRLADPAIFAGYEARWNGTEGRRFSLLENFRGREALLQFVNSVFDLLMRPELGGVDYAGARLQFGASAERQKFSAAASPGPRAELLLRLKGKTSFAPAGENGDDAADLADAEKEALQLALRLKELRAARHEVWDRDRGEFRAVEWRDMTVLLRAPSGKAESYAKAFDRAGVPLSVERGGFYEGSEIADLLSLLQLLDNPLQDVPAIAVLRSPLVGLTLDELAEIRLALPGEHFWMALNRSAKGEVRREKVEVFLERFARWRRQVRQDSLSRCLETILAETHYEDWLRGRNGGEQRRANVRQFVGLARRFDEFQRQGLFRFLRFIEAQQEMETDPEVAAVIDENAVRLMSIHQSKGLEFPVVAVADLGKAFNLSDLRAELILDGRFGLAPLIKPPQSVVRYPSLPHWLARRRQTREMLGEELRLLYVAMTRARDTLILSASVSEKRFDEHWNGEMEIGPAALTAAKSYADWLGLWFSKNCAGPGAGGTSLLRWTVHEDAAPVAINGGAGEDAPGEAVVNPDIVGLAELRQRLAWEYPFAGAAREPAKTSVTALRRREDAERNEEAAELESKFEIRNSKFEVPKFRERVGTSMDIGTAHHRFLQFVALDRIDGIEALRREAKRLERERVLSTEETAALDLEGLAAFWGSEFGRKIRGQADRVRRELAFTAGFSPVELAEVIGANPDGEMSDDLVVIQGVADLVVILPEELWLVDFKTDDVLELELAARAKSYEPQLKLYARALSRSYGKPVTECRLQFLSLRRAVAVHV